MSGTGGQTCYVSIQLSYAEKDLLDQAVDRERRKDPMMNRNRLLRAFIASLDPNQARRPPKPMVHD